MQTLSAYIPIDRRHALARGIKLPDRTTGAALFADISGFTPLTAALATELGRKRGAGDGSFVRSVAQLLREFYASTLQGIRPWRPPAPRLQKPPTEGSELGVEDSDHPGDDQ